MIGRIKEGNERFELYFDNSDMKTSDFLIIFLYAGTDSEKNLFFPNSKHMRLHKYTEFVFFF